MKRTLILISALFLMSMGVLAQMNIWRNGVVTHEFLLSDVDSITFGALPETPGDAIMLNYKLTEFEGDRYGNLGYCYNVIFTTPGTDFEVSEVDLGGQTGYQYILNKGTAYMIYIISDRVSSQVPEPGTYTIGWYDTGDSEYEVGEDYGRRGTFARGYNAAANMPGVDQHAPIGSYKMSKPEEGDYMVDYFDDDIYRYVRDGELEIIENANGSYTWNMTLKFNDLTTEKLTWTGKYEETEEEPEPELHPSLQGSDYFIFQMDDITYEKIASKVVADFRPNNVTNFLYIWENTYAAGSTQGLNFYGEPEGWLSLDVLNVGWSGCAYSVSDLELLNKLSAIMEEPENYYFHIAMKSTDNASHLLCLDGTVGSAKICVGESAFVDGGHTYQPMAGLNRDGSWNEIEICMADLLAQGLTYANNNTNPLNVLYFLSGGVTGTNLQFDAAFIYKKNGGEIAEPELGTVKVVVDAPENTCNGMVAVGTFCNWSLSEGYPFTKVEGSESLYEVTVPYSPDMVFKVIAKTLYDEIDWRYQWGLNRDGEEPNVVLLGTPGCVLDNSENGGEPKLVSFVDGSTTYVKVNAWKEDPCSNLDEVEQMEVSNILVDTYYGESIVDGTEAYTLILTNEQAGTTYNVSLASYPNDLAAPLEGAYTIVDELTTADQATITKVFGEGEDAVEVAGESGTLVISGNASNMEVTINITLADGEREKLHYSGPVQVEEYKWEMVSEHEILNVISMTLENSADYAESNYYYYLPTSSDYPAQGQLSAVVSSPQYPNGIMQIILGFLFNGDQQSAVTLPVGEYPFVNMYKGEGTDLDFITASDYLIYLWKDYYGSTNGYYFSSEISTITSDGSITNIFFPQSGTLKIENGTTEGTMKFTINATSFNGSTFQGTFELPEYVESSSAPQRLTPKAAPQWNTYLLKDAKLPNVPYKRAMR